jgi:hypothetical protein
MELSWVHFKTVLARRQQTIRSMAVGVPLLNRIEFDIHPPKYYSRSQVG